MKVIPAVCVKCDDAPLALFYRGNADLNALHVINMVGTRHATPYGQDICTRFLPTCRCCAQTP